ncbi:hypothetical protein NDU88_001926 [Pleurodeles waltl]|uniref:Uncharacterized protein n=1 Tax=Pleurodeles waltl TaxID=8319 RepID=A0AAV7WNW1_PLEWA|nr:hypothetical protein NDU88_001926 [Pleurodeles waltl]
MPTSARTRGSSPGRRQRSADRGREGGCQERSRERREARSRTRGIDSAGEDEDLTGNSHTREERAEHLLKEKAYVSVYGEEDGV